MIFKAQVDATSIKKFSRVNTKLIFNKGFALTQISSSPINTSTDISRTAAVQSNLNQVNKNPSIQIFIVWSLRYFPTFFDTQLLSWLRKYILNLVFLYIHEVV